MPSAAVAEGTTVMIRGDSIGDLSHIRVSVNDLVAYEYLDENDSWQWGLGTVAAMPSARVVRLLLWNGSGNTSELPPSVLNISPEERKKAEQRLKELLNKVKDTKAQHDSLSATLTLKQSKYEDDRREKVMEVDLAEQTLNEAKINIQNLKAEDWREIRSYRTPPSIVVLVLEAVMVLMGERAYTWEIIQRIIRQNDFAVRVANHETIKISEATKRRVRKKYLSNPKFTYHDAMNGSRALGYLQKWVVAQVQTSSAQEGLVEYDLLHVDQKSEIDKLQGQVNAFQAALANYEDESNQLRGLLEGKPVKVGKPAPISNEDNKKKSGAAPTPQHRDPHEQIHGTELKWRVTDKLIYALRSSILVNYDKPNAQEIRLTPEQIAMLKDSLEKRMPFHEQEKQAGEARKKLQDAIEDLRGENADLRKRLNASEAANHDLEKAKEDNEKELEKLNDYIVNNDVPLLRRKTPRNTPRNTPRRAVPSGKTGAATPRGAGGNGDDAKAREDALAAQLAELQEQLDRALHNNPTEAQVQLLEDDLKAAQDELRDAKDELDNFRTAAAPHHHTSSGLKASDESPEAQLDRALEYIEELEAQLEEMQQDGAGDLKAADRQLHAEESVDPALLAELRDHLEQAEADLTDCKQLLDDAETKLNDEIHAHNNTKGELDDLKKQNEGLWDKQQEAAKDKEDAIHALHDTENQLERLKDQLEERAKEADKLKDDLNRLEKDRDQISKSADADRDARAIDLSRVREILEREALKQRNQAKDNKATLSKVSEMLEIIPGYEHLGKMYAATNDSKRSAAPASASGGVKKKSAPTSNGNGSSSSSSGAAAVERINSGTRVPVENDTASISGNSNSNLSKPKKNDPTGSAAPPQPTATPTTTSSKKQQSAAMEGENGSTTAPQPKSASVTPIPMNPKGTVNSASPSAPISARGTKARKK